MTFASYLRSTGETKFTSESIANSFETYIWQEYAGVASFLKDKDWNPVTVLRDASAVDVRAAVNAPGKTARLLRLVTDLDAYALQLKIKLDHRLLKAQGEKEGRVSIANAQTPIPVQDQIGGDRVLHFTTAFGPIVETDKLRISKSSDQGCLFCIPSRYAGHIADCAPSEVKNLFDIRQDLSHYLEFNLENSRSFESYNSNISDKLKGQKELKIHSEILNLSRRDPVWYAWAGKSQGGWKVVPGPYNWGKSA